MGLIKAFDKPITNFRSSIFMAQKEEEKYYFLPLPETLLTAGSLLRRQIPSLSLLHIRNSLSSSALSRSNSLRKSFSLISFRFAFSFWYHSVVIAIHLRLLHTVCEFEVSPVFFKCIYRIVVGDRSVSAQFRCYFRDLSDLLHLFLGSSLWEIWSARK